MDEKRIQSLMIYSDDSVTSPDNWSRPVGWLRYYITCTIVEGGIVGVFYFFGETAENGEQ